MATEEEKERNRRAAEADPDHGKQQTRECPKHPGIRLDGRGKCSMCATESEARRRSKKP